MNNLATRFADMKNKYSAAVDTFKLGESLSEEIFAELSKDSNLPDEAIQELSKTFSTTIKRLYGETTFTSWDEFDTKGTKEQVQVVFGEVEQLIK